MRLSLRLKLTLVSLLLLLIPIIGFRFSELITRDLVESRQETLQFSARAVASALSGRTGLFDQELFHSLNPSKDLYLFQLTHPIRLNGKSDDWLPQLNEAEEYAGNHLLRISGPYLRDSLHFKHLLGMRGEYIFAIFLVTDDQLVYRPPGSLGVTRGDHLQIGIEDQEGNMQRFLVSAREPGWVNGFAMPDDPTDLLPLRLDTRIQGVWEETEDGYCIELRIPKAMIGDKFAFAIADVDDQTTRETRAIIGTATPESGERLGWLISPSLAIENILSSLGRPQSRILIVDGNQRVRASHGSLEPANDDRNSPAEAAKSHLIGRLGTVIYELLQPLYRLFTTPFASDFKPPPPLPTTLDISGIKEALQGNSSITSYRLAEGQVEVMAAIAPLREGDKVVGAVVVEQTTNSILALQNRVIEESLSFTILAFSFASLSLLLFASRLSSRIRHLRDQATKAISRSGKIRTSFRATAARDELGDLSRALATMLEQLKEQSEYRETMADNLEHEMRTPLAGISASLKNLQNELHQPPQPVARYLEWALADVVRLENLLATIREATNLQDALLRDTHEIFDLLAAVRIWIEHSWQPAFPGVVFTLHSDCEQAPLHGDPDRIRQVLDKLIENGVSFHLADTPLDLRITVQSGSIFLSVANEGPQIPEELRSQIFTAMVSRRSQPESTPHLGLGLYVARTIIDHHEGEIRVDNHQDGAGGVRFTLRFPLADNFGG